MGTCPGSAGLRPQWFRNIARATGTTTGIFALLLHSGEAAATGFLIDQQGVRDLGRDYAGRTAAADDLSTVFANPAGLIAFWENSGPISFRASLEGQVLKPSSTIRNTGSTAAAPGTLGNFAPYGGGDTQDPNGTKPIPNSYLSKKLADGKAAVGFGIAFPFGLVSKSPAGWFGRYDAIESSLTTVNASLVGAYRLSDQLSVGGGADLQYAKVKLSGALPNPVNPGGPTAATDGLAETTGHTFSPGFNIGLIFSPDKETRIGAHFRSAVTHKIDGTTTISGLTGLLAGSNGVAAGHAELDLPAIATLGLRHDFGGVVFLTEFEWNGWSRFKEIRIHYQDGRPDAVRPANYRDAYGFGVGLEYLLSETFMLRGGTRYESTPTTDAFRDTTVPDGARVGVSMGATYRMSPQVSFNFAYNHVFERATKIAITRTFYDGTPLATAVRIAGAGSGAGNTAAVSVSYGF